MTGIPFPDMPRQYTQTRSVPDHELLLVFRSDDHAIKFTEWLDGEGREAFSEWVDSGKGPR